MNNNLICAVKADTTGPDPDIHEIVELCVLPLNQFLDPHPHLLLFNLKIKPINIGAIDYKYCRLTRSELADAILTGIDKDKVADMLKEWFNDMKMPFRKKIIPLSHTWPIDRQRIVNWLGLDDYSEIFSEDYRDVRIAAHFINDRANCRAEPVPFSKQDIAWLAKQLDVEKMVQGGSCIDDCRRIAEVYKRQLKMMML